MLKKEDIKNEKRSNFRALLTILATKQPKIIAAHDYNENGDMQFCVNLRDLISIEDYYKYTKEFITNYVVDLMGELIIRENIELFMSKLTTEKNYTEAASKSIHKRFGMKIEGGVVTFSFHISLIQDILTEDFKIQHAIKDQKNEQ